MRRFFIIILPLLCQLAYGQDSLNLSLERCYKMARESHPYYSDKQRIIEANDLKIKNYNSQWLPQVSASGQATWQSTGIEITVPQVTPTGVTMQTMSPDKDQYKVTLDVNQMLYDGGVTAAQKKIASSNTEADNQQNEADLLKIKDQVTSVYFSLLVINENIKLLNSVKSTLEQRFKSVESAVNNGILQQNDLDILKIEFLKNKQQIHELETGYEYGLKILSELTGSNINPAAQIATPQVNIMLVDSISRPEIKLFESQQQSIAFSDRLTASQRLPKVYAFAQGGYGKPGLNMLSNEFDTYYMVGISFKWTLWDWNKTSRDRKLLLLQKDMVGTRENAFLKTLNIQSNNSLSRIKQIESSLDTDQSIVELREGITKRSTTRLDQGIITATDYLNDLNAETQSKIQLETHKLQLIQEKINYNTIKKGEW
jgi:outer membrane protein TolC